MNFLYFVPNVARDAMTKDSLIKAGLGDVLRDRLSPNDLCGQGRLAISHVTNGPGGHSGVILYPMTSDEMRTDEDRPPLVVGYYPDKQTWESAGRYSVGWMPGEMPTEEGLRRDLIIDGWDNQLADGRRWACPTIRLQAGKSNLPDVWGVKNGQFVSRVKPDWAWAWDLSGEIWDYFQHEKDIPYPTAFEWCVKLLAMNYRLGPVEVGALGLIGNQDFQNILLAAVNGPFLEMIREAEKKRLEPPAAEPVSTTPGVEA
jgi:hypothetical protein